MRHAQYLYHALAYGLAAEVDRPTRHSIPTQAATALAASGGRGCHRVQDYKFDRFISLKEAYVEVGGSYDEDQKMHTSYALSVIEGVNIADVLTADRVVSRMSVYAPDDHKEEISFDITGSHFDNLRIAGHKVEVKLATQVFHNHDTYSKVAKAHQAATSDPWLLGSKLEKYKDDELKDLEDKYCALNGISVLVKEWQNKDKENRPADRGSYLFSPANDFDLEKQIGSSELLGYGSIICIPKFGVIRLAELTVHHHIRSLTMFRVQMCSTGSGTTDGGGTTSGGTKPAPAPPMTEPVSPPPTNPTSTPR
ncbi:MAG TPA: hypothetical protein VFR24_16265 [Candidatus Angelobacter sp.]|nr:hypothetical protein [Candidatus Angelobacter sp.]